MVLLLLCILATTRAVICVNATVGRRRLAPTDLTVLEPTPASGGRAYVSCGSRAVDLQQWLVLAKSIRETGSVADLLFLAFGDDAVYNWQVPLDRHDVRSLDGARLAHFTHCGKPPSKINGRYDACGLLHSEWRETWARVAAESGVVA